MAINGALAVSAGHTGNVNAALYCTCINAKRMRHFSILQSV